MLGFSVPALAQRVPPTDTDLRAAYCIRVLHYEAQRDQAAANGVQEDIAKGGAVRDAKRSEELKGLARETERKLRETQARLDRVMAYVTPKLAYLDSAPIVAAFAQADADIAALQVKSCSADCVKDPACPERECVSQDVAGRLKPCEQVTWLPSY
jgi:hypothetical protein